MSEGYDGGVKNHGGPPPYRRPSTIPPRHPVDGDGDGSGSRSTISGVSWLERERDMLLRDASSHGPYLWTADDVGNALRWLDASATSPSQRQRRDKDLEEGVTDRDGNEGEGKSHEGREGDDEEARRRQRALLRSLLTSRGILERRHHGNPRRNDKGKGDGRPAAATSKTAEARERMEGELRRRRHRRLEHLLFVRAVARGYYRGLDAEDDPHAPAPADDNVANEDCRSNDVPAPASDADSKVMITPAACRGSSISLLKRDLLVTSLSRLATGHAHREAVMEIADEQAGGCPDDLDVAEEEARYFAHPDTAVRRAYAVQLYGRLQELLSSPRHEEGTAEEEGGRRRRRRRSATDRGTCASGELEAEQFLRKLEHLARRDVRVRETQFLMLLEPVRRLLSGEAAIGGIDRGASAFRAVPMKEVDDACSSSVACSMLCDSTLSSDAPVGASRRNGGSRKRPRRESTADNADKGRRRDDCDRDWPFLVPPSLLRSVCRCHLPIAEACVTRLLDVAVGVDNDVTGLVHGGDDDQVDDADALADRVVAATRRSGGLPKNRKEDVAEQVKSVEGRGRRRDDALSRLSSLVASTSSSSSLRDNDGDGTSLTTRLSLLVRETIEREILALAADADADADAGNCNGNGGEGLEGRKDDHCGAADRGQGDGHRLGRRRRNRMLALGAVLHRLFPSTMGTSEPLGE